MTKLEQLNNPEISVADYDVPTGEVAKARFRLRPGHWLLFAVGLTCLLFMAFITIARSIQVITLTPNISNPEQMKPLSAQVQLDTWLKLPLGNRLLVLPGEHTINATAEGFTTAEQSIEVASGRHQEFEVVLTPLPGNLDIQLKPEVFAKVALNGEPFGGLPGLLSGLPAGVHSVTIDAPLYRAETRSITIEGQNKTLSLQVDLQPAWANVNINSEPVGAAIFVDDVEMGVTPQKIKVEEGTHKITLQADKFKPFKQDISVVAQQDQDLPPIKMIPADGQLKITTEPSQAAIIINGAYRGNSPLTLAVKPNQKHKVQVYRAGYQLQNKEITLKPAQNDQQQVKLLPDSVPVRFSLSPSDAELYVDGVQRGSGNQSVNLNTLPHKISVRKAGYVTHSETVIPTKSSSQVVSVNLLTKEEHFWSKVPNQYTTDSGQTMKLFKSPGAVSMGSSRRETGRRSNEAAYNARLTKDFYVSTHEVTNKQFRQFKPAHSSGNYKRKSLDSSKHPVVNVSWQQAALYCNWLSKREKLSPFYTTKSGYVSGQNPNANGYRLLTETEWAWLARNTGGRTLMYPWGDASQPPKGKPVENFADVNAVEFIKFTVANYDDGYKASAPVGRFPANHNGLYDMGGNAAEWVNDWYSSNTQIADQGTLVDPFGPDEGEFHTIRGASWARGHLPQLRLAYRDFGAKGTHDVGFRIARYVGSPE